MNPIVTRFPPSPTGYLHIGGARTALFNWLHARHTGGKFVLRIEDTDRERSTQESVDAIFEALQWLGIDWDEGPFYQSQRSDIYAGYLEKLIQSGHAYYCTCPPEKLEEMRQKAMAAGENPKYDGTCREKGLGPSPNAVVRLKAPFAGQSVLHDKIKGDIVFQNAELDDFILQRSDGSFMYNFAVVVDDISMGINTVLRGDDHISNTPKQMLLYKALDTPLPDYGHLPMVLGHDRTRLSKRHGAMSVTAYRDMGYLPDALINYLVRLGWSHGDQEFFTRKELIEKFSLENIGKSAGIFNPEKLTALNADHIKALPPSQIAPLLLPFLRAQGYEAHEGDHLEAIIQTLAARSKTFVEMAQGASFYFESDISYDEKAAQKFLKPEAVEPVRQLIAELELLPDFSETALEQAFKNVMDQTGLKLGKIAQPVRVALTGKTASPGIFEIIAIIGKDAVIKRLRAALAYIEAGSQSISI